MYYYIIPGCVNISDDLDLSAKIRDVTLTRCYQIPGYADKSPADRCEIYDRINREVKAELTNTFRNGLQ